MNIIVFGGCGFLGSYVVDALLAEGHCVTVFDKVASRGSKNIGFINPNSAQNVEMIVGDIGDPDAVTAAVEEKEIVYNFAGLADLNQSINCPIETFQLNVMGNLNVLEACRKNSIRRFIYASSAYVFSNKGGFYGASKKSSELVIEQYAEHYGLEYTILRYGSVYGERADESNRIYRIVKEALSTGKVSFSGDGSEVREYIHGRDAGVLSVKILSDIYVNKNVILTGPEKFTYHDLLNYFKEIMNDCVEIEFLEKNYTGHYKYTPYSFSPSRGVKLVNNPSVDFGQGMLECIQCVHHEIEDKVPDDSVSLDNVQ